jgi:hypothetical protein
MQSFAKILLSVLDNCHTAGSDEEADASHYHHGRRMSSYQRENGASTDGSHYLGHTDGAVEQA